MKMRAKMVDGTPVTFEAITRIIQSVGQTEFVGEGFNVWSELWQRDDHRRMMERRALENAGVDTATVEYLDRPETAVTLPEEWFPLWPKQQMERMDYEPATPAMIDAGVGVLRRVRVFGSNLSPIIREIYEAMERARR